MRICDNCHLFFLNSTIINPMLFFSKFVNHFRYAFLFPFFVTENVSVSVILPITFYMHIFSNVYETTSNRTLFFI